jgi:signal transduction histidine kinase
MFQRLHGRKEYEGTGMGLAICRSIVERHRGRITARSTPGQGTIFLVMLPAQPREEELASHDGPTKTNHDPHG